MVPKSNSAGNSIAGTGQTHTGYGMLFSDDGVCSYAECVMHLKKEIAMRRNWTLNETIMAFVLYFLLEPREIDYW